MHYIIYAELQIIYYLDDFTVTDGTLTAECHAETSMNLAYTIKYPDKLIEIPLHGE